MKKLFLLFTLFLSALSQAAEIHTIYVGNTLDERIGPSFSLDVHHLHKMMDKFAEEGDLKVNNQFFIGEEATPQKVLDYIKNDLKCDPDDTIIFYFAGHGYRLTSKNKENNPWPNLVGLDHRAFDFQWVNTLLKEKKPRLLISFADCCNSYIPDGGWFFNWLNHPTVVRSFVHQDFVKEKIQNLFLKTKGHVIASGSHPGEYSFALSFYDEDVEECKQEDADLTINNTDAVRFMSLFTCNLIQTLNRAVWSFDQDISWASIMKQVTKKCVDNSKLNVFGMMQTPMYDIYLAKSQDVDSELSKD